MGQHFPDGWLDRIDQNAIDRYVIGLGWVYMGPLLDGPWDYSKVIAKRWKVPGSLLLAETQAGEGHRWYRESAQTIAMITGRSTASVILDLAGLTVVERDPTPASNTSDPDPTTVAMYACRLAWHHRVHFADALHLLESWLADDACEGLDWAVERADDQLQQEQSLA